MQLRIGFVHEARRGQAEALLEEFPQSLTFLRRTTATFEPVVPELFDLVPEASERAAVAADAIVGVMPEYLPTEVLMLLLDGLVAVLFAPCPDAPEGQGPRTGPRHKRVRPITVDFWLADNRFRC